VSPVTLPPGRASLFYQANADRVATTNKHDRDCVCRLRGCNGLLRTNGEDYVHTKSHEFRSKLWEPFFTPLCIPALNE
jgi:hypothetical protein